MSASRLYRAWWRAVVRLERRLRRLLVLCQEEGTVEQVHEMRVVLRRLRLYVRLARPFFAQAGFEVFRDWGRDLAAKTGPLRDADVSLEWLEGHAAAGAVARALKACRARQRRRLAAWPVCLSPGATGWLALSREAKPRRLAKRYHRFAARLSHKVLAEASRFFRLSPEARHEFRRTVRQWRYLHELVLAPKELAADPLLRQLLRLQEALGEVQNRQICRERIRRLRSVRLPRGLLSAMDAEIAEWKRQVRRALSALTHP